MILYDLLVVAECCRYICLLHLTLDEPKSGAQAAPQQAIPAVSYAPVRQGVVPSISGWFSAG